MLNGTDNRNRAKNLLKHYFWVLGNKSGVAFDNDINVELDELVDCLIDAAADKLIDTIEHRKHGRAERLEKALSQTRRPQKRLE